MCPSEPTDPSCPAAVAEPLDAAGERDGVRAALRALPDHAVVAFDRELQCRWGGGELLRAREPIGADVCEALLGEAVPAVIEACRAALGGRRAALEIEGTGPASRAWWVDVSPIRGRAGEVVGGLALARDVRVRRRREAIAVARATLAEALTAPTDDIVAAHRWLAPVGRLLGFRAGAYWTLDAASGRLRSRAVWGADDGVSPFTAATQALALAPGEGLPGRAWAAGEPAFVADVARIHGFRRAPYAASAGLVGGLVIPVRTGTEVPAVVEYYGDDAIRADDELHALAATMAGQIAAFYGRLRAFRRLRELAETDELTGLLNRRAFTAALRREVAAVSRYRRRSGLLLCDLDDLKALNDRHGHLAGDEALRHVAAALRGRLRQSDRAGRVGGDEFAVLAEGLDERGARRLAADLDRAVAATPVELPDGPITVSVSVGAAAIDAATADAEDAFRRADAAMYAVKRARGAGR